MLLLSAIVPGLVVLALFFQALSGSPPKSRSTSQDLPR